MNTEHKTLNVLYKLKKEILKSDNETLVSQIDHAIMKTYKDQLVFSFIGHYSAGKSSLINHLLDKAILPSSPVPTTSNTVAVQIGDSKEISAFLNQYQYVAVEGYDELRDLNTRDIDISAINIDVEHDDFTKNTVLQDTPGVDSSTDSHRDTTNRFLLNSDYIFFTVEYNHVESEHNLTLLKELALMDIPLILIINQVDKHDDAEISMETFLSRIRGTLNDWDIEPNDIFTTSIYSSQYNRIEELKAFIHRLERDRTDLLQAYFDRITKNIEDSQLQYLKDELTDRENEQDDIDISSTEAVKNHIKYLNREIEKSKVESLHDDKDLLRSHVKEAARKIVRDSYIFPHDVKRSITDYLEILAGEVKIPGLFGKKNKEQKMILDAKNDIGSSMNNIFKTEINAPVNSLFGNLGLTGEPFKYNFKDELLTEEKLNHLNNQFILNYLDKFKSSIVSDVTDAVLSHLPKMNKTGTGALNEQNLLESQLTRYEEILVLLTLMESIQTSKYRHFYIHLDDEIEKLNLIEEVDLDDSGRLQSESVGPAADFRFKDEGAVDLGVYYKLIDVLESKERYYDFYKVIAEKLGRIEDGKANISVFGGFSAGKTTFINALMNKAHLAMSPNPTTATITEINNDAESGITYKDEDELIDTLTMLSNETHTKVEGYFKWMQKEKEHVPETFKPFINGILNKYQDYEMDLGTTRNINTGDLIERISSDEDATFIHKAYVSMKNDITEKYTLVDSPGINSINQRHTKETRNIIADSDLILYVSYYNHVFSRSDEAFLKYIQSIKGENFPIIFIINAVDLMKSEADKEKVIDYMSNSLIALGITNMIFPVSSKRALTAQDDQFDTAKENIMSVADKLSSNVLIQSLRETANQLRLNIESNIRQYESADLERSRIETGRRRALTELESFSAMNVQSQMYNEIDVLLSFINKRFELKLYDYLKGLITVSHVRDKKYLVNNESFVKMRLEQFLTLEVSTIFNTIYRQAEELLIQNMTQFNERLGEANITRTLEYAGPPEDEPGISIDTSDFGQYSGMLYQARNNQKYFRDSLLEFAGGISNDIDIDQLKKEMETLIDIHLSLIDEDVQKQKTAVAHELNQPLPVIKKSDYDEDQKLLQKINALKDD